MTPADRARMAQAHPDLWRECPHCTAMRPVFARLLQLWAEAKGNVSVSGSKGGTPSDRWSDVSYLRMRCSACRDSGYVLTALGESLAASVTTPASATSPPDPDAEVPF
jgi:hypothetical protein